VTALAPDVRPVILCGGAGARLWPATLGLPKPFLRLIGDRVALGATLDRVRGPGFGRPLVLASLAHRALVEEALAGDAEPADLMFEPVGRDTAPAMAAAALHALSAGEDPVLAFVPSDHDVPDAEAFRAALRAAVDLARQGRLVVLGVRPTGPSPAYGYIRPTGPGPAAVARFIEKPDAAAAADLIAQGCLWNSGVLVARASDLVAELRRHVPEVVAAVAAAVDRGGAIGPGFAASPAISMDYAVLERTDRAWVLPVDFAWSDLGTWDAVVRAAPEGFGRATVVGGDAVWARAPKGMPVVVVGLSDVIVVVENGAVLVCAADRAQDVRRAAGATRDPAQD
jgi:mannose-1-phosphate guanylyltransferase/mannose-6-phosphate isomerase